MTDERREFNGHMLNDLWRMCDKLMDGYGIPPAMERLSDEVLAAYGIPPERAEVPAEEARKRTAALYHFRAAHKLNVSQDGD